MVGAGLLDFQAIATAKRMGAIVFGTDVRMASKEQVESLGGKFLTVEGSKNLETKEVMQRKLQMILKRNKKNYYQKL